MDKKHKKGMVFGVFDIFHPGHVYFLNEAVLRCEELTVVVARDDVVEALKNKTPKNILQDRITTLKKHSNDLNIVKGDSKMGEWKVLKDNEFDVVFLGYDQNGIAKELDRLGIKYEVLDSHHPEIYKSSLLIK